MTSHRATVTMPARDSRRGPSPDQGSLRPPAPPVRPHPSHGTAAAAMPPAPPAVRPPGVNGAAAEVAERYLAPALKAAEAARARTARIRAAAWAAAAGPPWPYAQEWRFSPQDQSAASPDRPQAEFQASPTPAGDLQAAEMTTAWTMSEPTATRAAGSAGLPAVPPGPGAPPSRGLSVADAARASRIAFQPLRRSPPANLAPPAAEPPAGGSIPTATRPPAVPTAPKEPPLPSDAVAQAIPNEPAKAVTRPGAARLLPAGAVRRAVPERPARQQRFAKTIAELQRYQAATRPNEPWGNVVPRPAVPQSNPATNESRWSRLWSRR